MTGGAGIKAAEMLARIGVDKVVTGSVGPNVRPILESTGVKIERMSGTIRDAVAKTGPATESNTEATGGDTTENRKRKPQGICCCPKCKYLTENDLGGPCFNLKCSQCGTIMERRYYQ